MGTRRVGAFLKVGVAGLLVWSAGSVIAALLLGGQAGTQWVGLAVALVSGLIAGAIVRTYPDNNVLPICWTLAGGIVAFTAISAVANSPTMAALGAGLGAAGYLGLAFRCRGGAGRDAARIRVTLAEMRRKLDAEGLLLTSDEVYSLKVANPEFRCEICKSSQHRPEKNWLEGFMRCPHNDAHVFHVKHFMGVGWRCPKDRKGLMVEQQAREDGSSAGSLTETEASDER